MGSASLLLCFLLFCFFSFTFFSFGSPPAAFSIPGSCFTATTALSCCFLLGSLGGMVDVTMAEADSCGEGLALVTAGTVDGCRAGDGGMYVVISVGDRCVVD